MTQLPDRYRITKTNPKPPLVHFAIPVDIFDLYKYADKHNLIESFPQFPDVVSPVSALVATERSSEKVQYELKFGWPFAPASDCGVILSLYDNYAIDDKTLIDEDQEDVIQLVQEELGWTRPCDLNGTSMHANPGIGKRKSETQRTLIAASNPM